MNNNNAISNFKPEITEKFEEGFNLKVLIAALFIGVIMLPGSIYLGLITGGGLGGAAQWVAVILLVEIAKRSFVQLKKQEIYILYILAGSVMSSGIMMGTVGLMLPGGAFGQLIWYQYLIQSPYAKSFDLISHIPAWIVPPPDSTAILQRTFFSKAWVIPIVLVIINNILLNINGFSLGYVLFRITSDKEKLPFPMAPVASEGATALAEIAGKKETWRWRIFSISAMIGLIYGAIYIVPPAISGLVTSTPIQPIPIPWFDYTSSISNVFPACLLGFVTDIGVILAGFVIPFWVVTGTFIASILSQCVGNPILFKLGMLKDWQHGMSAIPTSAAGTLDFWLNAFIGGGIIVGLIGIWKLTKSFSQTKNKNNNAPEKEQLPEGRGDYPIPIAILIWFCATLVYIVLCHKLVPGFPIWIFVFFGFIFTPFLSYISARMAGITGSLTVSFPMVREASFIKSGYKGSDIWFAPVPYNDYGGWTQGFKQAELTKTKFTSWYKAAFAALLIMLFCSFFFWSLIWHIAPIPSSTYPFAEKIWPINALFNSLWATSTLGNGTSFMIKAINFKYILFSALAGLGLFGVFSIAKLPILLFYGIVGGVSMMPHYAIPMFLGALLGRFYFSKKIGKENWAKYTPVILAGYSCGFGLMGMLSVAIALIAKTIYQLIF